MAARSKPDFLDDLIRRGFELRRQYPGNEASSVAAIERELPRDFGAPFTTFAKPLRRRGSAPAPDTAAQDRAGATIGTSGRGRTIAGRSRSHRGDNAVGPAR